MIGRPLAHYQITGLLAPVRAEPAITAQIDKAREKHPAFKEVYHAKFG